MTKRRTQRCQKEELCYIIHEKPTRGKVDASEYKCGAISPLPHQFSLVSSKYHRKLEDRYFKANQPIKYTGIRRVHERSEQLHTTREGFPSFVSSVHALGHIPACLIDWLTSKCLIPCYPR